ncbi:MAG: hypothetical protein Q7S20_10320 [Gemmatimonadaceae bacterium]|nr:hypothetical protein [Gemmatimonadaceae bacterium]
MTSARAFLAGLIDYAGLFPPASLEMDAAVRAYADYRRWRERDLLGRFVLPAARLDEFAESAAAVLPRGAASQPWRLSVIGASDMEQVKEKVLHFNRGHGNKSPAGHAVCDAIEVPVRSVEDIERALGIFPESFQLFLEIPASPDPEPLISALSGTRAAAKIRTGGVVAGAIPAAPDVLGFIVACSRHDVPFKATAGLHHAIRAMYPLTYEAHAPADLMYGYLNVFVAAAFARLGMSEDSVLAILEETDPAAFQFDESGVRWRGTALSSAQLASARHGFALSFGSCSFTEPVAEAARLDLL